MIGGPRNTAATKKSQGAAESASGNARATPMFDIGSNVERK
jgi:hypothetical protein